MTWRSSSADSVDSMMPSGGSEPAKELCLMLLMDSKISPGHGTTIHLMWVPEITVYALIGDLLDRFGLMFRATRIYPPRSQMSLRLRVCRQPENCPLAICSYLVPAPDVLRFEHTDDGPVLDHHNFRI